MNNINFLKFRYLDEPQSNAFIKVQFLNSYATLKIIDHKFTYYENIFLFKPRKSILKNFNETTVKHSMNMEGGGW